MSRTIVFTNEKQFQKKLNRLAKRHKDKLNEIVEENTTRMHARAKHLAPKGESKDLMQNIKITGFGEVTSQMGYSLFVEKSTRPHTIRVQNKKVLAGTKRSAPSGWNNFSRDWAIYGKEVKHPGTDAQPFMHPAFVRARKTLIEDIQKMFR